MNRASNRKPTPQPLSEIEREFFPVRHQQRAIAASAEDDGTGLAPSFGSRARHGTARPARSRTTRKKATR